MVVEVVKVKVTRDAICCDGCDYIIPYSVPKVLVTARGEEFHFHDGGEGAAERHDCFRYWAHNPRIMERSLKARDWDADTIDEFMSLMLYRANTHSPGIARPGPDVIPCKT